jgi:molecular chaperone GrpE
VIIIKEHKTDKHVKTESTEGSKIETPVETQSTETKESQEKHDKKHEPKESQIDELTNTLKRLQAEFENYKKRSDKESIITIKNANSRLVADILPVLDSFELALKEGTNENPEVVKFRKGLELIYTQLYSTLNGYGLKIIDTKNQKFDPYKHEVLMVKECSDADDLILQEFQKGYMLNDIIIRHSKVMIAKHVEEKK